MKRSLIKGVMVVSMAVGIGVGVARGHVEGYPDPEDVQDETGKEVYVLPVDGSALDEVAKYCIRVGSDVQEGISGRNLLEEVCNTGKSADVKKSYYSPTELMRVCESAGGYIVWVSRPGTTGFGEDNTLEACVTRIPLSGESGQN
jgi:hypothetical protein